MSFHPEIMPAVQQEVLRRLAPMANAAGFYLAGGTAVAIHLGHRRSVDLDWFTGDPIGDPMRLASDLQRGEPGISVEAVAEGTLHAALRGVHLSFLEFRYPLLRVAAEWPEYGCRLATLEDLACMKLSAIATRGARKDFIDLYALGQSGFALREMLDLYQEKFETRDLGHLLYSLTYFDDAEAEDTPDMLWDIAWSEVKATVRAWMRDLAEHHAPPA